VAEGKGKRRRSLHEAFGQEAPRPAAEEKPVAEPSEVDGRAEQSASPASDREGAGRPAAQRQGGQGGTSKAGKASKTSAPANGTGKRKATATARRGETVMVPGKNGEMVPAEKPVNMTFTVTAKERYLWTLELKRRGLTAVSVLRETMREMMGETNR
jgi:hypothetical protein